MNIKLNKYYSTRNGLLAYVGYETENVKEAYFGWIDDGESRASQSWDIAGRAERPKNTTDFDLMSNQMADEMMSANKLNEVIGGEEYQVTSRSFKDLAKFMVEEIKRQVKGEDEIK